MGVGRNPALQSVEPENRGAESAPGPKRQALSVRLSTIAVAHRIAFGRQRAGAGAGAQRVEFSPGVLADIPERLKMGSACKRWILSMAPRISGEAAKLTELSRRVIPD